MTREPGLLWFDDDPKKDWRQKVREGAKSYQQKFFIKANCCYINPKNINPKAHLDDGAFVEEVDGIQVYIHSGTLASHYFIFHEGRAIAEPARSQPVEPAPQLALF